MPVGLAVRLPLADAEPEVEGLAPAVSEDVGDTLVVLLPLTVVEGVFEGLLVWELVGELEAVMVAVLVAVTVAVSVGVSVGVAVGVSEAVKTGSR